MCMDRMMGSIGRHMLAQLVELLKILSLLFNNEVIIETIIFT